MNLKKKLAYEFVQSLSDKYYIDLEHEAVGIDAGVVIGAYVSGFEKALDLVSKAFEKEGSFIYVDELPRFGEEETDG